MKNFPLQICDTQIHPGERLTLALPTPELYTCAPMHIPIHVFHGKRQGPCLLICAAIHGDEMNGVAIIHKLLNYRLLKSLQGTLIAVPAINIYGLITGTRYLPDRRDLDGSFPGSKTGSFSSRLAYLFSQEILSKATHCIDIHTGEPRNYKFPQIQTNIDREDTLKMAQSFRAPVILHTESKRGLLWQMNKEEGIPTLIYDAGEALSIDELSIRVGVKGILRVMRDLGMLGMLKQEKKTVEPLIVLSTTWVRSPVSGLCQNFKRIGAYVTKGDLLAEITDPFGTAQKYQVTSPVEGVIISKNRLPLINIGEPILHIAKSKEDENVSLDEWHTETSNKPEEF